VSGVDVPVAFSLLQVPKDDRQMLSVEHWGRADFTLSIRIVYAEYVMDDHGAQNLSLGNEKYRFQTRYFIVRREKRGEAPSLRKLPWDHRHGSRESSINSENLAVHVTRVVCAQR
jgi:hypothetical protein